MGIIGPLDVEHATAVMIGYPVLWAQGVTTRICHASGPARDRALDAGGATLRDDVPDYPCHGDGQRPIPVISAGQKPTRVLVRCAVLTASQGCIASLVS